MNIFAKKLLKWYDQHGRKHLPWQMEPTPYRVWISEIMLQQTQVSTVIPYYLRFMARFSSIGDLAAAPLDTVLQHWAGLGYYARARNLHKAAQQIMTHYAGKFPTQYEQVVALPGIGASTAGAILAFSTHQRFPILDGNVKRILCRQEAYEGPPATPKHHAALWAVADHYTPHERIADYTQAIMDLGATLCSRAKPRCLDCPVQSSCKAYAMQRVLDFPVKVAKPSRPVKTRFFLIIQDSLQGILLYQRPPHGIWGGLWSLPEWDTVEKKDEDQGENKSESESENESAMREIERFCDSSSRGVTARARSLKKLPMFSHQFTHYQLNLKPLLLKLSSKTKPESKAKSNIESKAKAESKAKSKAESKAEPNIQFQTHKTRWCKPADLHHLGLPAPIKKLLSAF